MECIVLCIMVYLDIDVDDGKYDLVCSESFESVSPTLFIVRSEAGVFVGYWDDRHVESVLTVEEFSRVGEAGEYSGVMQTPCNFCGEFENNKLSDSSDMPSLEACHSCHNFIKEKLEEMIKDNCPEVVAGSL